MKTPKISDGIYQYREGVVKDLWLSKQGERFLYHLESPSSQFQCVDNEMIETLHQAVLQAQDRSMTAQVSTFYYKRKLLEATDAYLNFLPDFQGKAETVAVYFRNYKDRIVLNGRVQVQHGKDLHITSDKLTWNAKKRYLEIQGAPCVEGANFGKLTCDSTIYFDLEKGKITKESGATPLVFTRPNLTVQSQTILLNMEKTKPMQITFRDDVKLFNNEIVGIAEAAMYDFVDHSIQLVSEPNKEVLFYNKEKSFSMAAPKIVIEGNEVRGVGKVRFTFEETEKENILNLLQACLKNTF